MKRPQWVVLTLGALVGCGSVQVVKRDDCWVRESHSFPNQVKEEVGVCGRPAPQWSQDRVTRLVQECMADADYRWKNEALAAWNRGQPLPPEKPEHEMMQACMNDAATSILQENQLLQGRVAELTRERDGLRSQAEADHKGLRESQAQMTQALGEAAKRPAPNAFALSTSSGAANTKPDAPTPVVMPTVVPVQIYGAPNGAAPKVVTTSTPQKKTEKTENAPACAAPTTSPVVAVQPSPPDGPGVGGSGPAAPEPPSLVK